MQPGEEEPAEAADLGCGRPPVVAVSELTVDGATMAAHWEAREDYVDEVRAVSVILQQEQYLDGARVSDGALHVAQGWKAGYYKFDGYPIGATAGMDVLLTLLREGERVAKPARMELYSRIRSPRLLGAWRQLVAAIRQCLCTCSCDGLCGPAPEAAVLLAAERLHAVCGRSVGEYDWQYARLLSCQTNESIAILESEPVTAACGYGPSLPDALEYVFRQAGEEYPDPYPRVALARAIAAIFEVVAFPTVEGDEAQQRYRTMIEQASLVLGPDVCAKHRQPERGEPVLARFA